MRSTNKEMTMHIEQTKQRINMSTHNINLALVGLSPSAFKLYMFLHSRSSGWVYKPDNVKSTLGLSLQTIQRAKKELIELNYLYIDHEKRSDHYYLGQELVTKFKQKHNIPLYGESA